MSNDKDTVAVYRMVCGCGFRTRWEEDRSNVEGWKRLSNGEEQPLFDLSKGMVCCSEYEAVIQEGEQYA